MHQIKLKTLGSDPEVFIVNNSNQPVSSEGLVGGTKEKPRDLGDGIFIQEDNVAVEYNIPPCETEDDFVSSIQLGLNKVQEQLDKHNCKIHIVASEIFEPQYIYTEHGLTMGCEPDYNVYTGNINESADPDTCLRSCGGHIHLGIDMTGISHNRREIIKANIVKSMDLFLTVPSMLIDKDTRRRQLYGKAGSYRNKKYGLEARSLSNFWLRSEELIRWVYRQTYKAFEFSLIDSNIDSLVHDEYLILDAIENNNESVINQLCQKYKIELPVLEKVIS